jgi:hypothetical protein
VGYHVCWADCGSCGLADYRNNDNHVASALHSCWILPFLFACVLTSEHKFSCAPILRIYSHAHTLGCVNSSRFAADGSCQLLLMQQCSGTSVGAAILPSCSNVLSRVLLGLCVGKVWVLMPALCDQSELSALHRCLQMVGRRHCTMHAICVRGQWNIYWCQGMACRCGCQLIWYLFTHFWAVHGARSKDGCTCWAVALVCCCSTMCCGLIIGWYQWRNIEH